MHLAPHQQLEAKRATLERELARYGRLDHLRAPEVTPAPTDREYRPRLKWSAQDGRLGMFDRSGRHRVVDTPECAVAAPSLRRVGETIRRALPGLPVEAVDLREAIGAHGSKVLVTLVATRRDVRGACEGFADELMRRHPEVVGVALNLRHRDSPQVLGPETLVLRGASSERDRVDRAFVRATYGSFVQAHRGQARALIDAVAARVASSSSRPRVLELFGGSGSFGLELAARGADVVLVESFAPAASLAEEAAREQGIPLRAVAADAESYVLDANSRGERFDVMLVDPPRRGLGPRLRAAIASLRPDWLAMVSCHPATFARDLAHFAELGLRADRVQAFDMMPHTEEVEGLAFLEPGEALSPEVLARGDGMLVIDRPAHVPLFDVERLSEAELGSRVTSTRRRDTGASGAHLVCTQGLPEELPRTTSLVLAKGVTTARGDIHRLDYRRRAVLGGHSLLELVSEGDVERALERLAETGHPVVGGRRCDAATNRHFFEKHGLDRPFVHVVSLAASNGLVGRSKLAGDLAAVLASLGGNEHSAALADFVS